MAYREILVYQEIVGLQDLLVSQVTGRKLEIYIFQAIYIIGTYSLKLGCRADPQTSMM